MKQKQLPAMHPINSMVKHNPVTWSLFIPERNILLRIPVW